MQQSTFLTPAFPTPSLQDPLKDTLGWLLKLFNRLFTRWDLSLFEPWSIWERGGQASLAGDTCTTQGWQCSARLWPADGGRSSGKDFAGQPETPASLPFPVCPAKGLAAWCLGSGHLHPNRLHLGCCSWWHRSRASRLGCWSGNGETEAEP